MKWNDNQTYTQPMDEIFQHSKPEIFQSKRDFTGDAMYSNIAARLSQQSSFTRLQLAWLCRRLPVVDKYAEHICNLYELATVTQIENTERRRDVSIIFGEFINISFL
jgi:hypothetical protein